VDGTTPDMPPQAPRSRLSILESPAPPARGFSCGRHEPICTPRVDDWHRRVATGHNGEGGRSLFCRFLTAAPTHWHALAPNPFPAVRLSAIMSNSPAQRPHTLFRVFVAADLLVTLIREAQGPGQC
jgi:hypothetical protein